MQKLLFESEVEMPKAVNVASVPQLSPFRYAGGKTWFVPRLRQWLKSIHPKPKVMIEPFAGGAICSLTAVFEELVEQVLMVELDEDVAAVWQLVVDGEANWLADRIQSFELTKENVIRELEQTAYSTKEKAFHTILKNRTFHGGILAPGSGLLKKGEAGKGITSRWYPATLARRLRSIDQVRSKMTFSHGDGFSVLHSYQDDPTACFFIDPPYTAGGKKAGSRLYRHSQLDHEALFKACSNLKGDFIMTYDNAEEVKTLAATYHFQAKPIPMKNTHHAEMTELVIGSDLSWMEGVSRVLEPKSSYGATK